MALHAFKQARKFLCTTLAAITCKLTAADSAHCPTHSGKPTMTEEQTQQQQQQQQEAEAEADPAPSPSPSHSPTHASSAASSSAASAPPYADLTPSSDLDPLY